MTREEELRELARKICAAAVTYEEEIEALTAELLRAGAEGREAERRACAEVADELVGRHREIALKEGASAFEVEIRTAAAAACRQVANAIRRRAAGGTTQESTPKSSLPLTLEKAVRFNVCRICGQPVSGVLVLNYGTEFAHQTCVDKLGTTQERKES